MKGGEARTKYGNKKRCEGPNEIDVVEENFGARRTRGSPGNNLGIVWGAELRVENPCGRSES